MNAFYGEYRFFIWSDDTSENRMHVHVRHDGKICKFWLEPQIELADHGRFSEQQINDCRKIIEEHQDEFIEKFQKELKKSVKNAFVIDDRIKKSVPLAEILLKKIDNQWISDVIIDENKPRLAIEFKSINGAEPWIEISFSEQTNGQYVHFEIGYDEADTFEFNTTVVNGHENEVTEKIAEFIEKSYDGQILESN